MKESLDILHFIEKLAQEMGNYTRVRSLLKELMEYILKKENLKCVFVYKRNKNRFELWERKGEADIPLGFKFGGEEPTEEELRLNFKDDAVFLKRLYSFKKCDAIFGVIFLNEPDEQVDKYIPLVEVVYQSVTFNEKVQELLIKDDLTQLANSRYFHVMMKRYASDKKYHPVTVIFLDLDDFKDINDVHGHLVGGKTLREVGRRLDLLFENFPGAVLTRYGGDEFTILLPNTDLEEGKAIAIMLKENFETQSFEVPPHKFFITASFGVATFPDSTDNPDILLSLADKAMFEVKGKGKNNVGIAYPKGYIKEGGGYDQGRSKKED